MKKTILTHTFGYTVDDVNITKVKSYNEKRRDQRITLGLPFYK